jgi:hypothetical protein
MDTRVKPAYDDCGCGCFAGSPLRRHTPPTGRANARPMTGSSGYPVRRGLSILSPLPLEYFADDDSGLDALYAAAGTGSAVTDLIFSIAKREVTFFSGTAPISFL